MTKSIVYDIKNYGARSKDNLCYIRVDRPKLIQLAPLNCISEVAAPTCSRRRECSGL